MSNTKRCVSCKVRPQLKPGEPNFSYGPESCGPCYEEGGWENTHSDYGHDETSETVVAEGADESGHRVTGCWICYPELNLAQKPYTPRTGTSRVGVVHTVPIRESGRTKADIVAEVIGDSAKISKAKGGIIRLRTADGTDLRWEGRRFIGGKVDGKVVRNVAEALRKLAGK